MNPNLNGGTIAPAANSGSSSSSPAMSGHGSSLRSSTQTNTASSSGTPPNGQPGKNGQSSGNGQSGASIPISLYRELTAELQYTQEQLRVMSDRHETMTQQNQQLRAEISQLVKAVLQARYAANTLQPDAPIMPELDAALSQPRNPSENPNFPYQPTSTSPPSAATSAKSQKQSLEDALAAAITQQSDMMPPGTTTSSSTSSDASTLADALLIKPGAKIGSIKMPSHPRPLGTTQSQVSHSSNPQGKTSVSAPAFRGWGIVAVVMMVVITGFGMGFATTLWLQHRSSSTSR
ncbi:MAG: hypothetical protein WBA57_26470 [Elainellaceae cyanobacterium]